MAKESGQKKKRPASEGQGNSKPVVAVKLKKRPRDQAVEEAAEPTAPTPVDDMNAAAAEGSDAPAKKKRKSVTNREKKEAQRARLEEEAKKRLQLSRDQALQYLQEWEKQDGWKFNKAKQSWIINHLYQKAALGKTAFRLSLKYLQGLQGAARERLAEEARAALEEATAGAGEEEEAKEGEGGDEKDDEARIKRKRAKKVLKALRQQQAPEADEEEEA